MQQDVSMNLPAPAATAADKIQGGSPHPLPWWVWEPLAVLGITILVPALFLSGQRFLTSMCSAPASADYELAFSDRPFVVCPLTKPVFVRGSQECEAIRAILRKPPRTNLDGPTAVHLLRAYRSSLIPLPEVPSATDAMHLLTGDGFADKRPYHSPLVQTRCGARYLAYRPERASAGDFGENHRDVFLASFAEAALPLSTPLQVNASTTLRVSDLLKESVANFHLDQEEIEWTAIAYTLYMPRAKNWRNRDGEQFTFDQLARELLRRDLSRTSCAGAHLLYAMTLLLRTDEALTVLSPEVREALVRRLRESVATLTEAQLADGSWTRDWHRGPERNVHLLSRTEIDRLAVTGHLVEWLTYLPAAIQPQRSVYERAGRWLIAELQKLETLPKADIICPWTHAVCSLEILSAHDRDKTAHHTDSPVSVDITRHHRNRDADKNGG